MKKLFFCLTLAVSFSLPQLSNAQSETRNLSSFSKIENSGKLEVVLQKGTNESVQLKVKGIALEDVKTEVVGSTLKIYVKEQKPLKKYQGIVKVTYRSLEGITNSGSSFLTCRDLIEAESFHLTVAGSGTVDLDKVETEDIAITLTGSADVEVSGKADKAHLSLSGSGEIDADELIAESVSAIVSGSGNIETNANSSLHAVSSGSGDIIYLGSPDNMQTKHTGSGTIYKKEGF